MNAFAAKLILLALVLASDAPHPVTAATATSHGVRQFSMSRPGAPKANATELTHFFAQPGQQLLRIGTGTYLLPCGSRFQASGSLSIIGAGVGQTILRLEKACPLDAPLMAWESKSNVRLSGFTLDLNNSRSSTRQNILQFEAYEGNTSGLQVDHLSIINGNTLSLQIAVAAAGGFTYSGVVIDHNRLEMHPGRSQNQCIALSTVNAFGKIPMARITNNICKGSGIQIDGTGPLVAGNDVSAYQFGTGIFAAYVERAKVIGADWSNGIATLRLAAPHHNFVAGETIRVWGTVPSSYDGRFAIDHVIADKLSFRIPINPGHFSGEVFVAPEASSRNCVIRDNVLHDTPQTLDVNGTAPGGIENNCVDSQVENNRSINLGGAGFVNYASGATYRGNQARMVGFTGPGSAGGPGDNAAFAIADNGSGMPWYHSSKLVFESNSSEQLSGRPKYGYFEEPWHLFDTTFRNNSFKASEKGMVVRSASCRAAPVKC